MAQAYKGLTIPEYSDAADAPAAFTTFVDSGPIARFATAAARDAAIPAPVTGMIVYRLDVKLVETWNGTAWITPGLPLQGGVMTGPINMNNNQIQFLPDPQGPQQPVPLGFGDSRYFLQSQAIPWNKISGVPHSDGVTAGICRVKDTLNATDNDNALSAAMGKALNDNKLPKNNPVGTGSFSIPRVIFAGTGTDWDIKSDETDNQLHVRLDAVGKYAFAAGSFIPLTAGLNCGSSAHPWNNVYYSGALVKTSSMALKENIQPHFFDALSIIKNVEPKSFRWKGTNVEEIGFVAEDMPAPIRRSDNGREWIVPDQMIVTLWQAMRQMLSIMGF